MLRERSLRQTLPTNEYSAGTQGTAYHSLLACSKQEEHRKAMDNSKSSAPYPSTSISHPHHLRFHAPHLHLSSVFGGDWFALKAEAFARFFGTPLFLVAQTVIVAIWIGINVAGVTTFDIYPFVFLNLAFSLQAAYAAPLILLAQTRQADRDKAHADADAQHRQALADASEERQNLSSHQTEQLLGLMKANTELTQLTKELSQRIETLTGEMHRRLIKESTTGA
jgi:uncharacterized membrane protein